MCIRDSTKTETELWKEPEDPVLEKIKELVTETTPEWVGTATDLTEDEQINWFEVLNNAGSRVSIIQMRFSKLKAHGIDVYTQYTHVYRNKVQEYGCLLYTSRCV